MTEPALEIAGLHAGYDGTEVLRGIALTVGAGETVCLLGANGAGKTTLMRCIAGLLRPGAGELRLHGAPLALGCPAASRVGLGLALVPEGRRVFAPLSVRENLEMGAFRRQWPRRDPAVAADLAAVFALFPRLLERAGQPAGTLSGGEQQMLAIGRALMARPRLLLLDEPSMGLAPLVVREIFRAIRALGAQGMAILLAEQNARMALRAARRGYVLAEGAIVRVADSATLAADEVVQDAYLGIQGTQHAV